MLPKRIYSESYPTNAIFGFQAKLAFERENDKAIRTNLDQFINLNGQLLGWPKFWGYPDRPMICFHKLFGISHGHILITVFKIQIKFTLNLDSKTSLFESRLEFPVETLRAV